MGNRAAVVGGVLVAAIVAAALGACGEKSTAPPASPTDTIATITLSPQNPSIPAGSTLELTLSLADSAGQPLTTTGRTIEWTSTRTDVARVNDAGVVSALVIGTTTITATSERKTGTTVVTVVAPFAASVMVLPSAPNVFLGRTVQLSAVVTDANGNVLNGRIVLWSSSDRAIISVDDSGLVTGHVLGTATICAQVDGATSCVPVVVLPVPD